MDGNEKTSPVRENRAHISAVIPMRESVVSRRVQKYLRMFMKVWYAVFWTSACGFAGGVVMFLIDFFRLAKAKA
jgi:hypothetical protein